MATALLDKYEGLRSLCGRLMTTLVVGLRRQHCLVATALLVECKGLRSPCSRLMTTSVVGLRHQHCLVATALLVKCEGLHSPSELGHIIPERSHARGELRRLLVGASSSSLLAGASGLLVEELLAASSLLAPGASGFLVKELLAAGSLLASASGSSLLEGASGSSLLVGASGLLVEELSATALVLLAGASGLLVDELLSTVLVLPQVVNGPLPVLVGAFCAGTGPMKNGPPKRGRRQQASGLVVFAEGALEPFLIAKGAANASQGGCSVRSNRTPIRGRMGKAATT